MKKQFKYDHDNNTDIYGRFILESMEEGSGHILGNALRRILLSKIPGAAVTSVKIDGVAHEFDLIPEAVEDTYEIIKNISDLKFNMLHPGKDRIRISIHNRKKVRASDFSSDDNIIILNPDSHIVTLESGAAFVAEAVIEKGLGFSKACSGDFKSGVIPVNADFSPVEQVAFSVSKKQNGSENLNIEIKTNGGISPINALVTAVGILLENLVGDNIISGKFGSEKGTFVLETNGNQHSIGSLLCWYLMTQNSQDGSEDVKFAEYKINRQDELVINIYTHGSINPRQALDKAFKNLEHILRELLSEPVAQRGTSSDECLINMQDNKESPVTGKVSFGDTSSVWEASDLLQMQTRSYKRFLQTHVPHKQRHNTGLKKILDEIFPIESESLTLECLGYSCGKISVDPLECIEIGLTYSIPVNLQMRLSSKESGGIIREEEVLLTHVPLMTEEGVFIIRGQKRVVIGQLVGLDLDQFNDVAEKHVKLVNEMLCESLSESLAGLTSAVSDRMSVELSNGCKLTPSSLLCTEDEDGKLQIQQAKSAVNRFFLSNRFSQILQEINPLDILTHCRRISLYQNSLGADDVSGEPRMLHHSIYGRLDPMESPEGPNVGMINTVAMYAQIDDEGNILAPYRKMADGEKNDNLIYISAKQEKGEIIAPAKYISKDGKIPARIDNDVVMVGEGKAKYADAFIQQTLGPSTSLIPLLEHDDSNRALMGANMQRQAVPLLFPQQPVVQTGAENKIALDSKTMVTAKRGGVVKYITSQEIHIVSDDGEIDVYRLLKNRPAHSSRNWLNQKPVVASNQRVSEGQVIADCSSSHNGKLALGTNIRVAYMPLDGYNFEDAILVSERVIKDDILTSIHISTLEIEVRDTKFGREKITSQPPGADNNQISMLGNNGIVKPGSWVNEDDVLVGKITPKPSDENPEDKLLNIITGPERRILNYHDSSLTVPPGKSGIVMDVKRLSRNENPSLPRGVYEVIKVDIIHKRSLEVGDKLSNRHGSKGTIAAIIPEEDMPFLEDGAPVDMVLNPLGVPTRLNPGQILETHLAWAAKASKSIIYCPPYDGPSLDQIRDLLTKSGLPASGMVPIRDGRNGRVTDREVTVGYQYTMKLIHMVDDKIHARSTGPYSLFNQQPTGGKMQFGGQRFGEMETWALEAYGAAYSLRELLTVKSDDIDARKEMYLNILEGKDSSPKPGIPRTLNNLIMCLRGVCFDLSLLGKTDKNVFSVDTVDSVIISLASPDQISREWSHGLVYSDSMDWDNDHPPQGSIFCEKIFGPLRDLQCQCGKISGMQYKGKVCGICGVEVAPSSMRSERLGHIELAVPVCHNWLLNARPSPIAILLQMDIENIRSVIYYESYIVTEPGETTLEFKQILSKDEYRQKCEEFGEKSFGVLIGAKAVRELLKDINLQELLSSLEDPHEKRLVDTFINSGIKPEWMILECIPVIPPGIRPMHELEGGVFATLDLNELYARVISRNKTCREFSAIGDEQAHEAARMVQEAVDSLFGNGRRREGQSGDLKSLSDLLKGKTGMLRGNLLGKRVDYSGRSVIVAGPELNLDECALPEDMALELFKPFIIHKLVSSDEANSIISARKMIESKSPETLKALQEVIQDRYIVLNRAPTLHRLGIQAFKPRLTKDKAIHLHPLVCVGFNADFDGDQMAVHIPLSHEAQKEAGDLMLATKNVLSPSHGGTIAQPNQEMIAGCYYMTMETGKSSDPGKEFTDILDLKKSYELGRINIHDYINYHYQDDFINTTVGRILFNEIVPEGLGRFINRKVDKSTLFSLIEECHAKLGEDEAVRFLNHVDDLGFKYATRYGCSLSIDNLKPTTSGDELLNQELMSPISIMVISGARGSRNRLRNLVGVIGNITKASGELYSLPVSNNFMNGLSTLEHFMMTSGARNSLIDVSVRVGRAGHLMRKMVSACQSVVVKEHDCGTEHGIKVDNLTFGDDILRSLHHRIVGRVLSCEVINPENGESIARAGTLIDDDIAWRIEHAGVKEVSIRSPFTCQTENGLCSMCYGIDLASGSLAETGTPAGVIAAAATGEPVVQLNFRVFYGNGKEIIEAGIPRLDNLLEAREDVKITVGEDSVELCQTLRKNGQEKFQILLKDEIMRLYGIYGLNVNDKHFEILVSRILWQVRVKKPGDTNLYAGEVVNRQRIIMESRDLPDTAKHPEVEPVLTGLWDAVLTNESFLAAAAFGDTLNVLTQAAVRRQQDKLNGMTENLILGKLIPAGTGFSS
ncbi:hypothetical protein GF312_16030 [Candidatus Poribacteria bacterium]|nr:hypothetical protein [Candidatus Poribacteria bacterium]